jgi:hypothetical protein
MSSSQFDQDQDIVTLTDENGRSLKCEVDHSLEIDDYIYMLLVPIDSPVVILAWDEEEDSSEAIMIEDITEIEEIFSDAKAVLAELELNLKDTAYTLTVSGELPPLEDDGVITLEIDEEDSEIDAEELQFLADFYHLEQKYTICTPLAPLLFFARYNHSGKVEIVSPDDPEMQPIIEELLDDLE